MKSTFSTGFFGFGNQLNNDGVMMGTPLPHRGLPRQPVAAGMDPEGN